MSELLKDVAGHGSPEFSSRQHMSEAVSLLLKERTEYGSLLAELDLRINSGVVEKHAAVNPLAFMRIAFRQGVGFQKEMEAVFAVVSHDRPLSLILSLSLYIYIYK